MKTSASLKHKPVISGGADKTMCNTVASFSNGWPIFLLIMESPGSYCPVSYADRCNSRRDICNRIERETRSPASAGIANRPLVFATRTTLSGHNIEYLCLNLFTLRRFNNNESSGGRQILLPLLGGDAPRLG